jgi:5-oxoprolinase (ATP-hydrolysing) subunit A
MRAIDLNGDLGESYGRWRLGDDEALLRSLSSVNLACGFHASDPSTMRAAVIAANAHRVAIGAHPSFPDLRGFGRTPMALPPPVVRDDVLYQLGALQAICRAEGATLRHVKPHGALYHAVAGDPDVAAAVAEAVAAFDPGLPLVVPVHATTSGVLEDAGLLLLFEAFLDRGYQPDGRLVPRGRPGALLEDTAEIVDRALSLSLAGVVRTVDGHELPLQAHTLCLHGDGVRAAPVARAVRDALERAGVQVRAAVHELA